MTLALAALPALALAEDAAGSAAVVEGTAYTLDQMLTYALQDEYMAEAEYEAIQAAFGVNNPFANIMQAEVTHQELLLPLFAAYGIAVPANTAADRVAIPETLQETYEIGVQAEIANIAMYEVFLARNDLPQDVRDVFTSLMNASKNHLEAFSRNADKPGSGLGNGTEQGRNQKQDADTQARGNGAGRWDGTAYAAENCDSCAADQTQQSRGGRNGN